MRIKLITFFTCYCQFALGQYMAYEVIDQNEVVSWESGDPSVFLGVYHFGDSESESSLVLFDGGDEYVAQLRDGSWNSDGSDWVKRFRNFAEVQILGSQFSSNESYGSFVIYKAFPDSIFCLRIDNPWSNGLEPGVYELGFRTGDISEAFSGKYPEASYQKLVQKRLEGLSDLELKILRNEIFARYGYIFKSGGQMEAYFKKQTWYRPQHKEVNDFLTSIEKKNISMIRAEENRR